jgi:hypothetical protein
VKLILFREQLQRLRGWLHSLLASVFVIESEERWLHR